MENHSLFLKMDLSILGFGRFWKIKLEILWVGTRGTGLYLFNGKKFINYYGNINNNQ
jgi:hypothetical protein